MSLSLAARANRRARLPPLNIGPWLMGTGAGVVVIAVSLPLLLTLLMSVKAGLLTETGRVSLDFYRAAWTRGTSLQSLLNTLAFAAGATAVALLFGVPLAFIAARTDWRWRNWIFPLITVNLVVPVYLAAMAWTLLLSPKIGLINQLLMGLLGLREAPLNIYGVAGMAFVQGLPLASVAFFMLLGPFRNMSSSLEEAAYMTGVSKFKTFLRVDLPLVLPGLLGATVYIFMIGMGSFEVPAIIGAPQHIYVLATEIYLAVQPQAGLPNYNLAAAFGMVLLVIGLALMAVYWRILARGRSYVVVTGQGYRTTPVRLGPWRLAAGAFTALYFGLTLVLPLIVLLWVSFSAYIRPFSTQALGELTVGAYGHLAQVLGWGPIINTLLLVIFAPTLALVLSFGVSWIVTRTRLPGRGALDTLAFLPHATPAILMAVAFGFLFLSIFRIVPIYGTIWSLVLVVAILHLPFGTRAMNATMVQIHSELEEAGRVAGIPGRVIVRRVLVPLLAPVLFTTWLWLWLIAYREVTVALVFSSPRNQVIATSVWRLWQTAALPEAAALGAIVICLAMVVLAPSGRAIRRFTAAFAS